MTRRMSSRGPDAEGHWYGNVVVLGHRRLAILDLDVRSNQPMHSLDDRYSIVFNGEIYNFRELRAELEAAGEVFKTTSDTEVLLALYARHGEHMLPRLRGMFAFAIWDSQSRELFLARDPYGIKPLYCTQVRDGFLFASQVKALLASGLLNPEIESAGLAGFYLWGSVPEPWTLYHGVMALPAGSYLRVRRGIPGEPVFWRDIRTHWLQHQSAATSDEVHERVSLAVSDSVRAHLVSDVPVGIFLSGGIDSGAITGLIAQLGARVKGITIGFNEFADRDADEVPVAAQLASHYGLDHHVRPITRTEFEEDLPRFFDAMDQPTIDGLNTWFAAKAAAELGYRVVLSGVGGDELFYGYGLSWEIPRAARRNRLIAAIPGSRAVLRNLIRHRAAARFHPKLKGVPRFMGSIPGEYFLRRCLFLPEELPALIGEDHARIGLQRLGGDPPAIAGADAVNDQAAVCMLDSTLYLRNQLLRDSDWTSMAHSLELRTPLADTFLLDALDAVHTQFAHGAGKRLLAKSPADPLPDSIINRPKTGFSVPMTQWLSQAATRLYSVQDRPAKSLSMPWTRRWATVVMESFLQSGKKELFLPKAV